MDVVTGNTFTIAATFAKFEKVVAMLELPLSINVEGAVFVPHKNDLAKQLPF